MSEPREIADEVEEVVDGVWHWRIANAAIGGHPSSSHAVANGHGTVLVDPVRLAPECFGRLPAPEAVALTAKTHQRAAWRYRRETGAEVWLPVDAPAADEEPDRRYTEDDELPGGLVAIRTPGPERPHYSFLLRRQGGVLFVSDLFGAEADGTLAFNSLDHHEDPALTKQTTRELLDLPFATLCLAHGAPIVDDPKAAIRALLERDG